MKKIIIPILLTVIFIVSGCGNNVENEFSMKEKCSKYSEVAIQPEIIEAGYTLLTDFDKTNHGSVYNKELNTCLAYVEGGYSFGSGIGNGNEGYIRRIVVDVFTNKVLVDCHANTKGGIETERFEEYDPALSEEQIEILEHFKCYNQYHKYIN